MAERWKMNEGAQNFLGSIANSLGVESMDALAVELGCKDAQDLADEQGFVNIYAYFSAPGNHLRYSEIEFLLFEKRAGRIQKITPG